MLAYDQKIIDELKCKIGEKYVYIDRDRLEAYNFDGTDYRFLPEIVVEPVSTEQISALMKIATKYKFPVVPRGTGTGLTGGALAVTGGTILSFLKMNKILDIDDINLTATVQPGLVNYTLHQKLAESGLYYPPDPASYETSSIGGNIAEDAGGPHCYKYGTTRDYVLGMEVVLPDGQIIRTGVKTRKGVVGYDIHDLIIGSEGTLAIVTEATLRLIPLPQNVMTILVFFKDMTDVVKSMREFSKNRIVPATLEFMDKACTQIVRDQIPFKIPSGAEVLSIIEIDGENDVIENQVIAVGELCMNNDALDVLIAESSHKRKGLWDVRRKMRDTIKETVKFKRSEDIVVPVSHIPELIKECSRIAEKYSLTNYNYGHLGDGNVHVNLTAMEKNDIIKEAASKAFLEIFDITLALDGTISGEHGIGITKKPYLGMELSSESIRLQREIKKLFDPFNILNPEKIF